MASNYNSKKRAGQVLDVTGTICQGLSNFVPCMGLVSNALNMGANLLNPTVKKSDLKKAASKLSQEMRNIDEGLSELKNIISHTHTMVRDTRFRDGIEKINGAHATFINGSNNLEKTFSSMD